MRLADIITVLDHDEAQEVVARRQPFRIQRLQHAVDDGGVVRFAQREPINTPIHIRNAQLKFVKLHDGGVKNGRFLSPPHAHRRRHLFRQP